MNIKVGRISHYYDKIGVAVIEVAKPIKVGDKIKIIGHDKEFTQDIVSLQMEHLNVEKAKAKSSVGMKVDSPVKDGDEVYKVG